MDKSWIMTIPKKTLFIGGFVIVASLFIIAFSSFFSENKLLKAAASDNFEGFAWSLNTGWVSFNSLNCDTNKNGYVDSGACGGADNPTTPVVNYGVSVALPAEGKRSLSGYAWAQSIGYITFNQSELSGCPAPLCKAEVDFGSGAVAGWARACSVFVSGCSGALKPPSTLGNWDGWIELSGLNHLSPDLSGNGGVTLNTTTCKFSGYAWGGGDTPQFPGWIKFAGSAQDSSPYGVSISEVNQAPSTPTSLAVSANTDKPATYCPAPWVFTFSWLYSDPDANTMSAYQLEISKDPAFGAQDIVFDTGKTTLSAASGSTVSISRAFCSPSSTLGCGAASIFSFNTNYWWRVKVWDSGLAICQASSKESGWSASDTFHTPRHDWPKTDFHWAPAKPSVGETVAFRNDTRFDTGSTAQSYLWTFTGTSPTTDTAAEPSRVYSTQGTHPTTLQSTDDAGTCPRTKSINISPPLPKYREVAPQ